MSGVGLGSAPPGGVSSARAAEPLTGAGDRMNVLLVATRDPRGRFHGRKVVLRTILRSLAGLGHTVWVAALTRSPDGETVEWEPGVYVRQFALPGIPAVAARSAGVLLRNRGSLSEALFYSEGTRREIAKWADEIGIDAVVADMIRCVPYARSLDRPWIVDLDDLLSERYAAMISGAAPEMLLGYFEAQLPAILRRPLRFAAWHMLAVESRLLAVREVEAAREANAVALVSAEEARRLESRANVPVRVLPMAVDIPERPADRLAERPARLVFVGGLDYQPNRDAVRWYDREVVPHLAALGVTAPLEVIGHCDESAAGEFKGRPIAFRGYVDDLHAELMAAQVFVAPIVSGTGVKTKVLEAMAMGLPVVMTPEGARGLDVQDGRECAIARTPEEFAAAVRRVLDEPEASAQMARRGRAFVAARFSNEIVRDQWAEALSHVRAGAPNAGRQA